MGIEVIVDAMFAGAAKGGASRQSMAAMAAAVVRTWQGISPAEAEADSPIAAEVVARIGMSVPALVSRVSGKVPSGGARAFRNCAWHARFGEGASSLPQSEAQAKKLQRGAKAESVDPWLASDPWGGQSLPPRHTAHDGGIWQWQWYRPSTCAPLASAPSASSFPAATEVASPLLPAVLELLEPFPARCPSHDEPEEEFAVNVAIADVTYDMDICTADYVDSFTDCFPGITQTTGQGFHWQPKSTLLQVGLQLGGDKDSKAFDDAGWRSYLMNLPSSELRLSCASWDLASSGSRRTMVQRVLTRMSAPD